MKNIIHLTLIGLCAIAPSINAKEKEPLVYINKNIGFNVEGYKYDQPALPCSVDEQLVDLLIQRSKISGLNMQRIHSKEDISNGIIPVVLIDIEQLDLGKGHTYGMLPNNNLPKIQITAAVLKGKDLQSAKHTCAVASSATATLTVSITPEQQTADVCNEAQKCLKDLSKDVVEWLEPRVK